MGKLLDADKSTHDELRESFNRNIKASIQIEPHVIEPDDSADVPKPYCLLGVRFICGTDRLYDQTWFVHNGKREGPEWEKSKLIWRHLYQYVSDYIGAALVQAATQLADEAPYTGALDEKQLEQIFETSADLKRFYEALGTARKAGVPHDSEFQMWVGQHAFNVQQRLRGCGKVNVGSDSRLRFSPAEMKELVQFLEREQALWQQVRNLFWANEKNPEWRAIVREGCLEPGEHRSIDEDLLDSIAERTPRGEFKYRPIQVAVVSAARCASFDNKESWYSPPSMAQHRMIGRAVKEWRKRFEEAKQLNLRW